MSIKAYEKSIEYDKLVNLDITFTLKALFELNNYTSSPTWTSQNQKGTS
jgi:hypothetical protein